jgi:signal transduction histidine kinase
LTLIQRLFAFRLLLGLLAVLLGGVACTPSGVEEVALHVEHAQLLSVPGTRFTQPPAVVDEAALPSRGWATVQLPHIAEREYTSPSLETTATVTDWYQLALVGLAPSTEPRYLYIPRWKTIGQIAVYGDGKLLYQSEGSRNHNGYNLPLLVLLNGAAGMSSPSSLLVRIDRLRSSGSAVSTLWVGAAQSLAWRFQLRQLLQPKMPFATGLAFLAVGIYSLTVWLRRRGEALYILFFGISIVAFARMLHYHVDDSFLPGTHAWLDWLAEASLLWLLVLTHCFLEYLHQKPAPWLTRSLFAMTLLCSLSSMPFAFAAPLAQMSPWLYILLIPFAAMVFTHAVRGALRTRSRHVGLLAAWLVMASVGSGYDLALQSNWVSPEGIYTQPYILITMACMFSYIMFRRYTGAQRKVQQANIHLEQRLQRRESELALSYQRLREVEQNQLLSDERQRLMQDMHDGLGSSLISAIRSVEHGGMPESQVAQLLKDCMDDLKLAIDSMEPVEADLLLLLATLRFRLEPRMESSHVALVWQVKELPSLDWLDPTSALHILRIVQESVANILRHTQATEIRVGTAVDGAGVRVTIEDNGRGFDVATTLAQSRGRGLNHQQRRAQSIGGTVAWQSGAAGTQFTLWLPLERPVMPDR